VDFDHSINVAIGALRRVLGDSAANPQYIQTLADVAIACWSPRSRLETIAPRDEAGGTQALPAPASLIGRKVSHYRVLEVIGGGGMGMVYKAEDLKRAPRSRLNSCRKSRQ